MMPTRPTNWRLGFGLAMLTAMLWGTVPLVISFLLDKMDPVTLSWYRYSASGSCLLVLFLLTGKLRHVPRPGRLALAILVLGVFGLVGNSVLYVSSLRYIGPAVGQIVVQLGPVLLMLGSLWVFRERFGALQWLGFVILLVGIVLFCLERLGASSTGIPHFGLGVMLMVAASGSWAIYGLAQKKLLRYMPSHAVMMGIYFLGALLMAPAANFQQIFTLDRGELMLVVYLALNTLVAYGAFSEALNHWQASQISAVLASQPLWTLSGAYLLGILLPDSYPEAPLTLAALLSSIVVVVGSMTCALGGQRFTR